jgi:hypothetical protein
MDSEKLAFPKGCEMKIFIGKKFLLFLNAKSGIMPLPFTN